MERREFIKNTTIATAASGFLPQFLDGAPAEMPKRVLGRTGEKLSMLGFGGVLVMDEEQTVANDMVAKAFDHGINYFDVAPTYGNAQDIWDLHLSHIEKNVFLHVKQPLAVQKTLLIS